LAHQGEWRARASMGLGIVVALACSRRVAEGDPATVARIAKRHQGGNREGGEENHQCLEDEPHGDLEQLLGPVWPLRMPRPVSAPRDALSSEVLQVKSPRGLVASGGSRAFADRAQSISLFFSA
jgi:hypothetical protein